MKRKIITTATGVVGGMFGDATEGTERKGALLGDPELAADPIDRFTNQNGEAFVHWVVGYSCSFSPGDQTITVTAPDFTGVAPSTVTAHLFNVSNGDKFMALITREINNLGGLIGKDLPEPINAVAYEASVTGGVLSYTRLDGLYVLFDVTNNGVATPDAGFTDIDGVLSTVLTLGDNTGTTDITAMPSIAAGFVALPNWFQFPTHKVTTFKIVPQGNQQLSNQFVQPGVPFQPVTFQVLNEQGNGVPDVKIVPVRSRGGLGVTTEDIIKTDNSGKATFTFESLSEIGGAALEFSFSDPSILGGLTTILDEEGRTKDLNEVPYVCSNNIPAWCPSASLRVRLVRAEKFQVTPLRINIWADGEGLTIFRKINESLCRQSAPSCGDYDVTNPAQFDIIKNLIISKVKSRFNDAGVDVAPVWSWPTISIFDIDTVISSMIWWRANDYGFGASLSLFNPTWYNIAPVKAYLIPRSLKDKFTYTPLPPPLAGNIPITIDEYTDSIANTLCHEAGHILGLVNDPNLGFNDGEIDADGEALLLDPWNIMDKAESPQTYKNQSFREINKKYLQLILKAYP